MRKVIAQARVELTLTLRRGEAVLLTLAIPVGMLVFFNYVDVLPHGGEKAVDFLVPGVLTLSIVATSLVSLSIATAFERQMGMLRRLGATPLGRTGLLSAKIAAALTLQMLQFAAILATGLALGWRCGASAAEAAAAAGIFLLGSAAFGGLGTSLAGRVRAETNIALANGLLLVFLLLGGIVVPLDRLPAPLRAAARALPAEPLASSFRALLAGKPAQPADVLVLAAWAAGACVLAAVTFRWE